MYNIYILQTGEINMHKLFIIGNGFDCYGHFNKEKCGMKTKYEDFRKYIVSRYPHAEDYYGVPEENLTIDHHGYDYDDDDIVGYIVQVLDLCQDDKWSSLESCLGNEIFSVFSYEFLDFDVEDKDNEIYRIISANEQMGKAIAYTFSKLKELFQEWVDDELSIIDYSQYAQVKGFKKVLVGCPILNKLRKINRTYINFNYTETLEKVYKIPKDKVFHLHGSVGSAVCFGHGNTQTIEVSGAWGAEDSLNSVRQSLLKDTSTIIADNYSLFASLNDVTEIYSYGFSFSDVDMVYIDEICRHLNPTKVNWFFNTYDTKFNPQYIEKIRAKGFSIKEEHRWDE